MAFFYCHHKCLLKNFDKRKAMPGSHVCPDTCAEGSVEVTRCPIGHRIITPIHPNKGRALGPGQSLAHRSVTSGGAISTPAPLVESFAANFLSSLSSNLCGIKTKYWNLGFNYLYCIKIEQICTSKLI